MVKPYLEILLVILLLAMLSSNAYALSLGSIAKNDFAEISLGKSAKFQMLFWNPENDSYIVRMSVEYAPQDWTIIIDPNEFVLNNSVGEEYISLPYDKNIRAKTVNVFVKPNEGSVSNRYNITIGAYAVSPTESSLVVIPRRSFNLVVDLEGLEDAAKIENNTDTVVSDSRILDNIAESEDNNEKIFYIAVIALIVGLSIFLYKKY